MNINESAENYLETILLLSKQQSNVRAIDIVNELGYKKSSVSVAMKNLKENHFITVSSEGHISLTEAGTRIAEMIYERHTILSSYLIRLGVDPEIASNDACKIEHIISPESFLALKNHLEGAGCCKTTQGIDVPVADMVSSDE